MRRVTTAVRVWPCKLGLSRITSYSITIGQVDRYNHLLLLSKVVWRFVWLVSALMREIESILGASCKRKNLTLLRPPAVDTFSAALRSSGALDPLLLLILRTVSCAGGVILSERLLQALAFKARPRGRQSISSRPAFRENTHS